MQSRIGKNNSFFGKHHTEASKKKMRLYRLGKRFPTGGRMKNKEYIRVGNVIAVKINITKNKCAIIDEMDFEKVNQHKWQLHSGGYACAKVRINGKSATVYLHRFILDAPKEFDVDHINLDKLDNRKSNLRPCNMTQNLANMKIKKNNTSGYKGVSLDSREYLKKRWFAQIKINKKTVQLGRFLTKEEAALAYNAKALEVFGGFARINIVS